MGLFGSRSQHRAPAGWHFGRDLAHHEHAGWRKLVLVRHGQTEYNVKHLHQGHMPGIPLNAEGRREAQATAAAIRDLPLTAIVASPLDRTMETAGFINGGRGLEIKQDRDLIEVDFGPYVGKNWDELDKPGAALARFHRDPRYAPRGVENFVKVQQRAVRAAERWRQADGVGEWVALVTHADLVKLIIAHYIHMPIESVPLLNMDNAAVSLLAFQPGSPHPPALLCLNWTSPALWIPEAGSAS